mmetsp:Transcript_35962/g.103378  ORF Transcript_35962/g.103378 Transcript_35962/m.103378 type:complete len:228 (+) Transcript_35962:291-974(+)
MWLRRCPSGRRGSWCPTPDRSRTGGPRAATCREVLSRRDVLRGVCPARAHGQTSHARAPRGRSALHAARRARGGRQRPRGAAGGRARHVQDSRALLGEGARGRRVPAPGRARGLGAAGPRRRRRGREGGRPAVPLRLRRGGQDGAPVGEVPAGVPGRPRRRRGRPGDPAAARPRPAGPRGGGAGEEEAGRAGPAHHPQQPGRARAAGLRPAPREPGPGPPGRRAGSA